MPGMPPMGMPPGMPPMGMQISIPGLPGANASTPMGPGGMNFVPSPFMSQLGLPPAIMALFAPRQPLTFKPPQEKRKLPPLAGVAAYSSLFESERPADLRPWQPPENKRQKKERTTRERKERNEAKLKEHMKTWDPNANTKATSEPLNTLFVARLNYESTEQKLRREFETYGPVKNIKMITDLQGVLVEAYLPVPAGMGSSCRSKPVETSWIAVVG